MGDPGDSPGVKKLLEDLERRELRREIHARIDLVEDTSLLKALRDDLRDEHMKAA
jgi:hypothetical protein